MLSFTKPFVYLLGLTILEFNRLVVLKNQTTTTILYKLPSSYISALKSMTFIHKCVGIQFALFYFLLPVTMFHIPKYKLVVAILFFFKYWFLWINTLVFFFDLIYLPIFNYFIIDKIFITLNNNLNKNNNTTNLYGINLMFSFGMPKIFKLIFISWVDSSFFVKYLNSIKKYFS